MPPRPRFAWLPSPALAAMALASVLVGCASHGPEPLDLGEHEPTSTSAPPNASDRILPASQTTIAPPTGLMVSAPPRRIDHGPSVKMIKPTVHGSIDTNVVRRVVRGHLAEVRACYMRRLARDPTLEGYVTVLFVIDPRGEVPQSEVVDTSLSDLRVAKCIAKAVRGWRFPKPKDGSTAAVRYPFVLAPPLGAS